MNALALLGPQDDGRFFSALALKAMQPINAKAVLFREPIPARPRVPPIRVRLTDAPYCAEPMSSLPHPSGPISRSVMAAIVAVALAQFSGCSTINEHDRHVL